MPSTFFPVGDRRYVAPQQTVVNAFVPDLRTTDFSRRLCAHETWAYERWRSLLRGAEEMNSLLGVDSIALSCRYAERLLVAPSTVVRRGAGWKQHLNYL